VVGAAAADLYRELKINEYFDVGIRGIRVNYSPSPFRPLKKNTSLRSKGIFRGIY
jgi:hypothetical protein